MSWLGTLLSGKPHFCIGGKDNPYIMRWYLIPRNRLFNVYLHKFCRDDDDRALHDHPWWFVSIMLRGQYDEWIPDTEAEEEFGLRRDSCRGISSSRRTIMETSAGDVTEFENA